MSGFTLASTTPNIVYINSRDRVDNGPGSPTTIFKIKFAFPAFHAKKITLLASQIPDTVYAFRDDAFVQNNLIDFIDSSGLPVVATITPGTYTSAQIINELQTQLMAVSPDTYTVTYNPTTLKLTITSSSPLFQILGATGVNILQHALYLLGYENADTTPGAVQLAPNVINMEPPKILFVKIANFQAPIHGTAGSMTSMFAIPINDSFGNINFYEQYNRHESLLVFDQRSITQLDIELCDDTGKTTNLNGADWSMLLRFD